MKNVFKVKTIISKDNKFLNLKCVRIYDVDYCYKAERRWAMLNDALIKR